MSRLRTWLYRANGEVPVPVAATILVIVFLGAVLLLGVDWSLRGLPPKGAPGRVDWANQKYYKQWRLQVEAEKAAWLKQHPEYAGLSPYELRQRMRERSGQ